MFRRYVFNQVLFIFSMTTWYVNVKLVPRVSYLNAPSGGKMRNPGNEAGNEVCCFVPFKGVIGW